MQRYVFKKNLSIYDFQDDHRQVRVYTHYRFDSAYAAVKRYPDFTAYVIYFCQGTKGKNGCVWQPVFPNAVFILQKIRRRDFLDSSGAVSKTRFINENQRR